MIDVRSPEGQRALRSHVSVKTLYAFDFDGTLAPLVSHPNHVQVAPHVRQAMQILSQAAPVAIITGRKRADILPFFPFPSIHVIGNHGAEDVSGDPPQDVLETCVMYRTYLSEALHEKIVCDDVRIEDKTYSLTVHCKNASDIAVIVEDLKKQPSLPGCRFLPGIRCINLIPLHVPHKGTALIRLMDRLDVDVALYAGDDITDEDVFGLDDPRVFGIRIGVGQPTKARYFLSDQSGLEWLLPQLLAWRSGRQ